MPKSRRRRGTTLLTGLLVAGAALPASALAAPSVTVTGDDGNPVPVPAGGGVAIRNMSPTVAVSFPPSDARFKLTLTDQAGQSASAVNGFCFRQSTGDSANLQYRGNQTYVATVTEYAAGDSACATPTATTTHAITIAASVAIVPPAAPFAWRAQNQFATTPYGLTVQGNPGASGNEVHFARNGTVGPDGDLVAPFERTSTDQLGQAKLFVTQAGRYKVVARATRFVGGGEFGTPWSAPVDLVVKAPFDFRGGGLDFTDRRGPSYAVRATLRDLGAAGKVSVALARGTKGGRYRSLGTAKISSRGTIAKRFRVTRQGTYRLRFTFKGSEFGSPGRQVVAVRFSRFGF